MNTIEHHDRTLTTRALYCCALGHRVQEPRIRQYTHRDYEEIYQNIFLIYSI